jgi:sensor c-di-GMP phosphodiesterase-like protein
MAEDAHMSEVMHEKIQWTFVNVQQIWLEVREGVFQKWKAAK